MTNDTLNHEDNNLHNQKGTVMEILTFLRGSFRVITNNLNPQELEAYNKSKLTRRPETMGNGVHIQAVETGQWFYALLDNKLNKRGKMFRLGMISNSDLMAGMSQNLWTVNSLVDDSTFSWANASYSFFLRVDGEVDFGLESLGLQAIDNKKTSKRLQEITRITQIRNSGPIGSLDYEMCQSIDPKYDIMYDGGIYVRMSFMLDACKSISDKDVRKYNISLIKSGQIGPMIARILIDKGEIKGLLHVVADDVLSNDVVFHESALKKELYTVDGTWHFTAFRHKMLHKGMWDMQTAVNNHSWLTTEERFHQDLAMVLPEIKSSVDNGVLPSWILCQEEALHNDEQMIEHDHVTSYWIDAAKRLSHVKLQQNQIPVTASANIVHMAYGSIVNQMRSALMSNRMWVPMSQSFVSDVITVESINDLGNIPVAQFVVDNNLNDKLWFHEEFGVVFSGERFANTADLHDTWDQDGDNALFIRIRLWSSDDSITKNRKKYKVIPDNMVLPSNPDNAIDACVVIRRPNSPGGYSIEMVATNRMPFMRIELEPQLIDLAITPPSLDELLADIEAGKINSTKQYSGRKMTRDDAKAMISAQMANPGVGSFANAVMVHASMFGPSFPKNLVAQGNDVIDIVQQESDRSAFMEIKNGVSSMWESLSAQPQEIDSYILATRVPGLYQDPNNSNWVPVEGSWTRMYKQYLSVLDEISLTVREGSFHLRQNSSFVKMIMEEIPLLSVGTQQWAKQFFMKYDNMLKHSDKLFRVSKDADRFVKANAVADRSDHVSGIVQLMVDEIRKTSFPEKYAAALYRWVVDPQMTGTKYGLSDRIIFQGGKNGQESVMDLFIEGVLTLS